MGTVSSEPHSGHGGFCSESVMTMSSIEYISLRRLRPVPYRPVVWGRMIPGSQAPVEMIYKYILTLLLGSTMFLVGTGLLNTLIGVRAGQEGFTSVEAGIIMSAYFTGYLLGIRFLPSLINRIGHIRAFASFASAMSAIILAHGIYFSPLAWGILRLMSGVCVVGFFLVIETWLNTVTSNEERGGVFSAHATLSLMAIATGQFFLLSGGAQKMELFAFAAFFTSVAIIPVAVTYVDEPSPSPGLGFAMRPLWNNTPLGLVGALASGLTTGSFWGMVPFYFQRTGFDSGTVALIMGVVIFSASLMQWPIGRLSDMFDRRWFITGACASAGAMACFVGLVGASKNPQMLLAGFAYGGAAFSLYGLSVAHANDYILPEYRLAAAKTLITMFGLGAMAGPLCAGVFMSLAGPAGLMWFYTLIYGLTGIYSLYRISIRMAASEETKSFFVPMIRSTPATLEMDPRLELIVSDDESNTAPATLQDEIVND